MEQNIQEIFARFPGSNKDNLIPILQEIQKKWGFLSEMDITLVSQYLKIPIMKGTSCKDAIKLWEAKTG